MSAASSTVSTSASPTARFALTRLIQGIFVVWVAVTITFIGLHLAQCLRRAR